MFITPMNVASSLEELNAAKKTDSTENNGAFKSLFQNAIDNAVETEKDLVQKQYLLATGQIDDTHTVPIAASKAQLSMDLLVSLRSKSLDVYNEMMRMSV